MARIFRRVPPEELALRVFECFGLKGLNDEKEFAKKDIKTEMFSTLLPELEPFYTKHKKFMVTRPMENKHYIQVLRNLCQVYGLVFHTKTGEHGTKYRVLNPKNPETNFYHLLKDSGAASRPFVLSFT
jgi:hypothetical protein